MWRLKANNTHFDFHDLEGARLSIAILERFNIEYVLEKI